MILGVTTAAYTLLHVLISLAGIGSGFVVKYGLLTGKRPTLSVPLSRCI